MEWATARQAQLAKQSQVTHLDELAVAADHFVCLE